MTLTAAIAKGSLLASFDHERVLQVLANLVSNAIKFTAEGGTIAVRVEPFEKQMRFAVADTGSGIPAASGPEASRAGGACSTSRSPRHPTRLREAPAPSAPELRRRGVGARRVAGGVRRLLYFARAHEHDHPARVPVALRRRRQRHVGAVDGPADRGAAPARCVPRARAATCCSIKAGFFIDVDGAAWSDGATVDELWMTLTFLQALAALRAASRGRAEAHPWEESGLTLVRDGDRLAMSDVHHSGHVAMRPVEVAFGAFVAEVHREARSLLAVVGALAAEVSARRAAGVDARAEARLQVVDANATAEHLRTTLARCVEQLR